MKTPKFVLILDWFTKADDPKTHGFTYIDLDASTLLEAMAESENRIKSEGIAADLYLVKICELCPNIRIFGEKQGKNAGKIYHAVLCSRDVSRGLCCNWHTCNYKHSEDPNWYISRHNYSGYIDFNFEFPKDLYDRKAA